MKAGHIAILLKKDMFQGPKNLFVVLAIIVPMAMALFVSLAFGTLFTGKASIGLYAGSPTAFTGYLEQEGGVNVHSLDSEEELILAVTDGDVDIGLVLPPDFDETVRSGRTVRVSAYMWGESLANDRMTALLYITGAMRKLTGHTEPPVHIISVPVGDEQAMPWSDRLLPMIVLMAVAMSGLALAGSSFLEEKINRTFEALNVTQITIGEIFFTKGLFGSIFGLLMGVTILLMNRAFGAHPWLLMALLLAGSIMMICIGLLISSRVKDTNSFFAAMKGLGFFLYLPGILFLFPQIPRWVSMVFPTHYLIHPISEISLKGRGPRDVMIECIVLVIIDLILVAAVAVRARKLQNESI